MTGMKDMENLKLRIEGLQALSEKACALLAQTLEIAPRTRTRPDEQAQQLVAGGGSGEAGMVGESQIVAKPVERAHWVDRGRIG